MFEIKEMFEKLVSNLDLDIIFVEDKRYFQRNMKTILTSKVIDLTKIKPVRNDKGVPVKG